MLTAETIYQKARQLDSVNLQEASDFIDFLLNKIHRGGNRKNAPPDWAEKASAFWQPQPLSDYLRQPKTAPDMAALDTDFWPEEESIDDFVSFIRQQRREDLDQAA